jgi:hypothetical protein
MIQFKNVSKGSVYNMVQCSSVHSLVQLTEFFNTPSVGQPNFIFGFIHFVLKKFQKS